VSAGEPLQAAAAVAPEALAGDPDPFLSRKRGGTEIYLIRHADALPEADEVVAGGYDDQALSELGRRQAAALAARLREVSPSAVYSSPIGRAVQTARAIAAPLSLEVTIEAGIREVELAPLGPDAVAAATPAELATYLRDRLREIANVALTDGVWSRIPGAEPSSTLRERATAAIDGIAARHAGERVAVVSNGGTINAYIAALLGVERDYFFPAANTSISMVRIKGARRLLMSLNDVAHLHDLAPQN
jgi:broad specificity phosphatase PhoE